MRTTGSLLIATASAAALLLLSAARHPAMEAPAAQKYFGCPTGYTFQVSGSNARCYLAGTTVTADIVCPLGYVKTQDQFANNRDGCQSTAGLPGAKVNTVANYTCPSGYDAKPQAGPDVCVKQNPPSIIAPTVEKAI